MAMASMISLLALRRSTRFREHTKMAWFASFSARPQELEALPYVSTLETNSRRKTSDGCRPQPGTTTATVVVTLPSGIRNESFRRGGYSSFSESLQDRVRRLIESSEMECTALDIPSPVWMHCGGVSFERVRDVNPRALRLGMFHR